LRGGSFSPRPLGGSPPGAAAAAHGTPGDRPLRSSPYLAAASASTTARPMASRRVRQSPEKCVTVTRAGTPRIVRAGPSSVKGTPRSFLKPLRRNDLRDPPLSAGASASPAGLTARARPEARPGTRTANLSSSTRHLSEERLGSEGVLAVTVSIGSSERRLPSSCQPTVIIQMPKYVRPPPKGLTNEKLSFRTSAGA